MPQQPPIPPNDDDGTPVYLDGFWIGFAFGAIIGVLLGIIGARMF